MAALHVALRAAAKGRGAVVVLRGQAGIGKSRLLEATATLAGTGFTTLTAHGSDLEHELPFGAVLQLLEHSVRETPGLLAGSGRTAEPLFSGGAVPAGEGNRQLALIHGLYRLVGELAETRPLALLVDDAHLVDLPSLRFLNYLARRLADLPVLLAVALRPQEPGAAAGLLEELLRAPGATRLEPGALSDEAVAGLIAQEIGGSLAPPFVSACIAATRGNPLLVRELALALAARGASG